MKILHQRLFAPAALLLAVLLTACGADDANQPPPAPHAITSEAVGHYCGMNLDEHAGPKGQILLRDTPKPVWFTTIRQVFAYTILPEEPKAIRAIYVQDMAKAPEGGSPPDDAWINALDAFYVIESGVIGGMGAPDALPFGHIADAHAFVRNHGGRVVTFDDMPEDYIFSYTEPIQPTSHADSASARAPS